MTAQQIKDYYGKTLSGSADLKTDACCDFDATPAHVRRVLAEIDAEVLARYYGCGLVVPQALDGAHVLDLGCGVGRDCFVLSKLVGETGSVAGVDMTPEQLAVARRHIAGHAQRFGYAQPNTTFHEGYIERLGELGLAPASFDIIVSNCVINLSSDKDAVLKGAWDLLKPGGEFYFADVYADRRLDPGLRDDPVLLGECLAGALYWNDFLTLAKRAGFADPRLVASRPIAVTDEAMRAKLGRPTRFFSATYRLFKLDGLDPACEDYGQAVIYRGGIAECPDVFALDNHHRIEKGRVFPVCGNTYRMLRESRFAAFFDFIGDFTTHYGIFDGCGTAMPFDDTDTGAMSGCC